MNLHLLKETPPWDWPEGTGKMLPDILRDGRAAESDRVLAAELAGDLTVLEEKLADALLFIVRASDESDALRAQAAISLGPVLELADTDGFEDPEMVPISEATFHRIQECLRTLYVDAEVPQEVRRRILEASVRAPQEWHPDAIRAASASGDDAWRLTAVFCMRFVSGFDTQILEALKSDNSRIHYEAVCVAGDWGVEGAWPHIAALVASAKTEKPLRLAAIEAVASIRPHEAPEILGELTDSADEDIVEAAYEALAMAEGQFEDADEDEDEVRP